jgi:hypothetical protein
VKYKYVCIIVLIVMGIAFATWINKAMHTEHFDMRYFSLTDAILASGYALNEYEHEHNGKRPATLADLHNYMKHKRFRNDWVELHKRDATKINFQYNPDAKGNALVLVYYDISDKRRIFWLDARSRVFVGTLGYLSVSQFDKPGIVLDSHSAKDR